MSFLQRMRELASQMRDAVNKALDTVISFVQQFRSSPVDLSQNELPLPPPANEPPEERREFLDEEEEKEQEQEEEKAPEQVVNAEQRPMNQLPPDNSYAPLPTSAQPSEVVTVPGYGSIPSNTPTPVSGYGSIPKIESGYVELPENDAATATSTADAQRNSGSSRLSIRELVNQKIGEAKIESPTKSDTNDHDQEYSGPTMRK